MRRTRFLIAATLLLLGGVSVMPAQTITIDEVMIDIWAAEARWKDDQCTIHSAPGDPAELRGTQIRRKENDTKIVFDRDGTDTPVPPQTVISNRDEVLLRDAGTGLNTDRQRLLDPTTTDLRYFMRITRDIPFTRWTFADGTTQKAVDAGNVYALTIEGGSNEIAFTVDLDYAQVITRELFSSGLSIIRHEYSAYSEVSPGVWLPGHFESLQGTTTISTADYLGCTINNDPPDSEFEIP